MKRLGGHLNISGEENRIKLFIGMGLWGVASGKKSIRWKRGEGRVYMGGGPGRHRLLCSSYLALFGLFGKQLHMSFSLSWTA